MRVTSTDVPRRPIGLRGWLIGAAVLLIIFFLSARGPRALLHGLPLVQGGRLRHDVAAAAVGEVRTGADLLDDLLRHHARQPHRGRPPRAALPVGGRPRGRDHRALPHLRRSVLGPAAGVRLAVLRARDGRRRVAPSGATGSCSRTRSTSPASRTRSSTRTSASTCSACRSFSSRSAGRSRRCSSCSSSPPCSTT